MEPSVTYTSGGFRWNARTDLMMVEPQEIADWRSCSDFAAAVLEKLPHTPLSAVGINFVFDQQTVGPLDLPGATSAAVCAHLGGEMVEELHVVRVRSEGWTLNLKSVGRAEQPMLDFNFHHDVSGSGEVCAALGNASSLYERAAEILGLIAQRRQPS